MTALDGFVLTRGWRDTPDGVRLTFWLASGAGPLRVNVRGERGVMFVERDVQAQASARKSVALTSMWGAPVDALYFDAQRELRAEREQLRRAGHATFESDVKPSDRYLMERFINGPCRMLGELRRQRDFSELDNPRMKRGEQLPSLRVASFDIETDGELGAIVSIAMVDDDGERVMVLGDGASRGDMRLFASEKALLEAFFAHVRARDPDVLIGWNVVEFDLSHIQRRCDALSIRMDLGRGGERAAVLPAQSATQLPIARIPGRAVLDGIGTAKAATHAFERFGLDHVARVVLGRGKEIEQTADRIEEIRRLWRDDKPALAAYNLEDCRLVRDIFAKLGLMDFAVARSAMTGLELSRIGGSVAAFDHLYLPRLHRHGHVGGEVGRVGDVEASPGGYVLASRPGLYDNVLVLDYKSLYPSIIVTFKIDPMGLAFPGDDPVAGFDGARFARERHILPAVIDELWNNRDDAKRRGDEAQSRAIKILMNSFYGVLGAPACRFHSPMLASSITRRGHEIITTSRDWLEQRGHDVIYGDTDSLFVLLGGGHDFHACRTIGERIARELNAFWQAHIKERHGVDSRLELEFETHYRRFFMPTLRGSDEGSAKRYAGMVGDKLVIKGLEAVRTDWTALARTFQRELIRRVFEGEPFADWIQELRARLLRGELDDQLVYRKRIRRDVDDYVHNLPPHVKAAKLLDRKVRDVAYVMTTRGPQPIQKRSAPIDHGHYLARQLAPAADGILATMGTSFANIAGDQLQLFDVASNDGFGLSRPPLRRRNAMPDDNNDNDNTNSEEMMLVGSKVKAALKAAGCNSSSDVLPALNAYVGWILKQAAARAGENGRKTVRGHDILIVP